MPADEPRSLDRAVERLYTGFFARAYDPLMWLVDRLAAREAWRELLHRAQSRLTPESDVLDAACGTGRNLRRLDKMGLRIGSYLGVDRSEDMLRIARRRFGDRRGVTFRTEDLRILDLGRTFDVILCSWVLSHMDEPGTVVHTLNKHLRAGGTLFLIYLREPGPKPGVMPALYRFVLRRMFHARPLPPVLMEKMGGVLFHKTYFGGLIAVTEICGDG